MRRQLAQVRPTGTTAETLFSPAENKPYNIDTIVLANISAGAVTVTLYHDADGTTYDNTTAIVAPFSILVGETIHHEPEKGIADYRSTSGVGVKTSVADSVVCTVYGEIKGEKI